MLFILILLNVLLLFDNFLVRKKIKIFEVRLNSVDNILTSEKKDLSGLNS